LPASPARAASIVAFNASRFVCSAIEVITFTTLPISWLDNPSLVIVSVVACASLTACAATRAASFAFWLISRIEAPICSAPAATVPTFRETSSAAADTTPDCAEVSSADAEICADEADNSSDDAATASAEPATEASTDRSDSCAWSSAAAIRPTSSPWSTPLRRVRSPAASAVATAVTAVNGRTMRRTTASAMPSTSSAPRTTTTTMVRVVLAWLSSAAMPACAVRSSRDARSSWVSSMIPK
jgi:hypothetical protein